MRFLLRSVKTLNQQQKANGTATLIALFALLFLQIEYQPRPAGADSAKVAIQKSAPVNISVAKIEPVQDEANLSPEQLHEKRLAKKIELLEKGIEFLSSTPDYTAQFSKRELVNGELLEEQTMAMKVRHEPFSVYLKWMDFEVGREVMYVDGIHDGKMMVHAGGWKSRLPAILLAPECSLAMKEARYPVTRAGIKALADTILEYNRKDLSLKNFSRCHQTEDQMVGDRQCHCFVIEYKDPAMSADYRKSITLIDKEWCVPLFIKNFGWPNNPEESATDEEQLDEATLIEHYSYTDIKFRTSLSSLDFDHTNEDYGFKRQ